MTDASPQNFDPKPSTPEFSESDKVEMDPSAQTTEGEKANEIDDFLTYDSASNDRWEDRQVRAQALKFALKYNQVASVDSSSPVAFSPTVEDVLKAAEQYYGFLTKK